MAEVKLCNVTKIFPPNIKVLDNISLEIKNHEFITILGPTGSGKTTLLKIIAGLEEISSGKIFIDNEEVTYLPPNKRNVAMVFQEFALYPHMSVLENITFGLKKYNYPKEKIAFLVDSITKKLEIDKLLNKYPKELSWGQKQRVALSRAFVREPKLFLLDEPLSNLDAKIRRELRIELKRLHNIFKITTIYVTHDQSEAMSLSDRIVLLKDGKIWQVGTPEELYFSPIDLFVAEFIGPLPTNFFQTQIIQRGNNFYLDLRDTEILLPQKYYDTCLQIKNKEVIIGIKPEHLYDRLYYYGEINQNTFYAYAHSVELLGDKKIVTLEWYDHNFKMVVPVYDMISPNDNVEVVVDTDKIFIFDRISSKRII